MTHILHVSVIVSAILLHPRPTRVYYVREPAADTWKVSGASYVEVILNRSLLAFLCQKLKHLLHKGTRERDDLMSLPPPLVEVTLPVLIDKSLGGRGRPKIFLQHPLS